MTDKLKGLYQKYKNKINRFLCKHEWNHYLRNGEYRKKCSRCKLKGISDRHS